MCRYYFVCVLVQWRRCCEISTLAIILPVVVIVVVVEFVMRCWCHACGVVNEMSWLEAEAVLVNILVQKADGETCRKCGDQCEATVFKTCCSVNESSCDTITLCDQLLYFEISVGDYK